MIADDRSKYLQFVLTDPRYCGNNSFYTATDALLTLEAEVVKKEETQAEGEQRTQKQIERLPVVEMLHKYGLREEREHLLLAGKPGSGKSTTLRRLCVEMAEIAFGENLQPIPVFVQLKGDKQIVKLIQAEFRRAKLKLTDDQIDDLLLEDKLVLLLDGVNEIPSEELRRELQDFRENNLTTPMIFTTRDLAVGGSLGIDKRLEMRPLTDLQMREFVHKYLPEHGDKLLGQLRDRLREIAETPLLLKMLCEVFEPQTGRIPQNKAELFELFDLKYQRHKEGVAISPDFRRFQSEILQYLAFTMLQGDAEKPTEAWLTLSRSRAEGIIEVWLKQRGETDPASKAKEWLEDLVEHHLLQVAADPQQVEFHHQLFQEYYAARYLRSMLQDKHPDLVDDERLKHFYLNYLKWTEPLGLLLGLLDDEAQALRLVGLGLEVDWFLGARLAGKVKVEFQPQTVGLVNELIEQESLSDCFKIKLWEETRSSILVSLLLPLIQHFDSNIRESIVKVIERLGNKNNVQYLLPLLDDPNSNIQWRVLDVIERLGDRSHVSRLLAIRPSSKFRIHRKAAESIGKLENESNESYISKLLILLRHSNEDIRQRAIGKIVDLGDRSYVRYLLPLLEDSNTTVIESVVRAIGQLGNTSHLCYLLPFLEDDRYTFMLFPLIDAVSQLCDTSHVGYLLTLLKEFQYLDEYIYADVSSRLIETIGQLGNSQHVSSLLPLLQNSDPDVRGSVQAAIFQLADKDNLPTLLPLLKDPDLWIRPSAIDTIIKQLKGENYVSDLLGLLRRFKYELGTDVKAAILRLADKSHVHELLPLLQDFNSDLRLIAVEAIGQLGDESNLPDLLPLLKDPKIGVIHQSILAIQARCEFYNYDIFRSPPTEISPLPTGNNFPKATEVKIFEHVDKYYQNTPQNSS
jgi:HEAT repeat protein